MKKECLGRVTGNDLREQEARVRAYDDFRIVSLLKEQRLNHPDAKASKSQRVYNRVVRREARKRGLF
jgi:hypothetical protein